MNNPRKILIFSTSYYPLVGGAEVAVKEITDRLPEIEFDMITARHKSSLPEMEKVGNVNVYRVGSKFSLPWRGAWLAWKLNRKNKYDYFWCIMVTFASGAAYIANFFQKPVPIILNLQEGDSEEHFATRWFGLINLSWRLALARTSVLTVLSNYLGERARRFGYKGEVKLVPNGVDVGKFSKEISNEEKTKVRNELGLGEDETALITVSRLVKKNGVGDVIEALKFLPDNIKFLIIGEGELEAQLKIQTKNSKLDNRVVFVGFVENEKLPSYLQASDIFIRSSLSEGFGISFVEAMATRIPVIATPVGGIPDFLQDGETGYFCEPENPESIKETVMKVLNDQRKNEVVERALAMVSERYDWDKIGSQMKAIFDKVF